MRLPVMCLKWRRNAGSVVALVVVLAASMVAVPHAWGQDAGAATPMPTEPLTIDTQGGGHYRFAVEIASTIAQQEHGLMFRRQLAADAGMLFVEKFPHVMTMWMENTYIPLDMLFIDAHGHILNIAERTTPMSRASIMAAGPVIAVLEVNGGTTARLGIRAGDRVEAASLRSRMAPR